MVSAEKLSRKLVQLEEYLGLLSQISQVDEAAFAGDKILIGSAKYYLQVSIECCLDIANHIISAGRLRAPRDYADTFGVLVENGVIAENLGTNLRQMAKFRNRLVHLYGDIDDHLVYRYLNEKTDDIRKFRDIVISTYDPGDRKT